MLLGEHAVLHGRRALVCAIDRRITVTLRRLELPVLRILSELGQYESPLRDLRDHSDFRFILDILRHFPPEQGVELEIASEFSSDIGFGSSAAVTVAVHAALMKCVAPEIDEEFKARLFQRSLATLHRVQGRGSGADLAAAVFGGVVAYRVAPLEIVPLPHSFALTAVYSGAKMKTAEVIRRVEERRQVDPEKFERIFDGMEASVGAVLADFSTLGNELICNQRRMEEMELSNAALAEIVCGFQALNIPAKISGSGLGDCVIGLGAVPALGTFPTYALRVAPCGVC
jgi:mevalonate kinase